MIKVKKINPTIKRKKPVGLPERNTRHFFGELAEKTNFEIANALLVEVKKVAGKKNKVFFENDKYSLKEIIDLIGISKFRQIVQENTKIDERSKPLLKLRASQKKVFK